MELWEVNKKKLKSIYLNLRVLTRYFLNRFLKKKKKKPKYLNLRKIAIIFSHSTMFFMPPCFFYATKSRNTLKSAIFFKDSPFHPCFNSNHHFHHHLSTFFASFLIQSNSNYYITTINLFSFERALF